MSDRIQQFRGLVASQPANVLFRFSLAQALEAAGQGDEAIEHYRLCAEGRRDWMMPRILLAKALLRSGQKAEARPILEDALALAVEQAHEEPERELRALLED